MQSYSAVEFDALAEKYASLNWRLVSKPGGATVKPDDFYVLYGCAPHSGPIEHIVYSPWNAAPQWGRSGESHTTRQQAPVSRRWM